MAQLDDFSKIIVGGHEISKVLHQGKTIWQAISAPDFSDPNLWELGYISGFDGELRNNTPSNKRIRTKEYSNIDSTQIKITNSNLYTVFIYYWNSTDEFVGRVLDVQNSTITPMAGAVKFKLTVGHPNTSQDVSVDDAINANVQIQFL